MPEQESQPIQWSGDRFPWATPWTLLITVLGVSLWAQLFVLPVIEELGFEESSQLALMAYVAPFVVLVPGALYRLSPMLLLLFPLSLMPGLFALPERTLAELGHFGSMVRLGITLVAYVGVVAASFAGSDVSGDIDGGEDAPAERVDGVYPFYFVVRAVILLALLVVTQYAAFHDPAIARAIAEHYPERPQAATTFVGLFIFFAWCVVAYTMFFVPLMNVEYDVRRLSRSVDEMLDGGRRGRWLRVAAWAIAAAVALGTLGFIA